MKLLACLLLAIAVLAVPSAAVAFAPTPTWGTANSVSTGDQDAPAIAANRSGYVAVAWEDDRDATGPADNAHSEIFVRLFRDGASVYELKLSAGGTAGTAWRHLSPDVGLDDKGNAVVVWADDPDGNGFYNIPYRVLSPTGTVLASGRANASADGQQIVPKVAVDPDGAPGTGAVAFAVVWEDIQGTGPATVRAAGYTGPATKAYEVAVNAAGGAHHRPDVAVPASGEAIIVWDEDTDGNGFFNVGLVRLAKANGAVTLSRRTANANAGGQQWASAVAANVNGDFVVAWQSDHTGLAGVWARSFTVAGAARHTDVEASVGSGAASPSVGLDDQANAVLAWTVAVADPDVWVRGLNPDGGTVASLNGQRLSQATAGRQELIGVAVSAWGEVFVAYTDDNDGNTFDQIILGSGMANAQW